MATRRAWLILSTVAAAATVVVATTGCGFALRRAPELYFRTVQLTGFAPRSPLAELLTASINASQTTLVVDAASKPQVVFEALNDTRERSVVASTAAAEVRELQLRSRLKFRLRTAGGRELIEPTEILLSRDMSYREGAALGKEQEEAILFRAMQADIVAQVMRRLAAVKSI